MNTFTALTTENEEAAKRQLEATCGAENEPLDSGELVVTLGTIEDFRAARGKEDEQNGSTGYVDGLFVWKNIQKNGKGSQRGDLKVYDFGAFRVASFL